MLIDQTWGGAWQDWWDDWWKGWTNQHANLLSHAVAVRRCGHPVRHYKLIETWDGWEPFDIVHDVPGKLRWAMWAWSHAAVVTPDGLEVPDGTYVSWMNDRHRNLLDAEAVAFVADELDRAETDAAAMTEVGGPLLLLDHDRVARHHDSDPCTPVGEHVEDAVALAMKWGLPVLGATSAGWDVRPTAGVVGQLTGTAGGPEIVIGRADAVDPAALARAGAAPTGERRARGYRREAVLDDDRRRGAWVHLVGDSEVAADPADVIVSADGWPTLVAAGDAAWWQPPELADPANPLLPRSQYGSVASARAVARWWSHRPAEISVGPIDEHTPATVQWWRCGDRRTVLVGNLETGWIGDARTPRRVALQVRAAACGTDRPTPPPTTVTLDVPPEGCTVHHLDPCPPAPVPADDEASS